LIERLTAGAGEFYGPASALTALLARATPGRLVPPRAFWPPPKVQSQMLRLDFDQARAAALKDARALQAVLSACFGQRRKTLSSGGRLKHLPLPADAFLEALVGCGINPSLRPEQVSPQQYLALANALCALERS
jgi:16S rRNA (adenine1518-N6/adenine1519-N6)-dimethyltransferase